MASQILNLKKLKLLLIIATLCIGIMKPSMVTASLTQQCGGAIQQLISCLNYAKGGTSEPTKECCTSVSSMKEKQPVCLCFFIGQAHNGTDQIKSLGIQEGKLLELPSACHLANASASNCPKLLGISPSSPAASIFLKNGTSSPPGTPSSSSSSTGILQGSNASGIKHGNGVLSSFLVAVIVSAILCTLPMPILV
ncbi:non-specific lipid transfer protein GPI-anchored 1-like [Chenopodium quinoa]|uniref:non-specific lipid transfer protein GPI-anchored 1-like n=1 Tax=Chenopodium quinoa TaxID=63459 RepID=UPI000B773D74|nr:non-specific lipid transfer protein GPI-anchored 1-like [Chenopodium quinoa]